jgi:hypothetical protein
MRREPNGPPAHGGEEGGCIMHHWKFGTTVSVAAALLFGVGVAAAESSGSAAGSRDTGAAGTMQQGTSANTGSGGAAGMQADSAQRQAAMNATAADIAQQPGQYFGKRVSLTTQVRRSIDPHFFTVQTSASQPGQQAGGLGTQPQAGGMGTQPQAQGQVGQQAQGNAGQNVLVLIPAPVKAAPESGQVTISGTVRPMVVSEIQRDYDWFESGWLKQADVDIESTTYPVIVADSVTTADGTQLVQAGSSTGTRAGDAPAASGGAGGANAPANPGSGTSGSNMGTGSDAGTGSNMGGGTGSGSGGIR